MTPTAEALADRVVEHFGTLIVVGEEARCDRCGSIHLHLYALASEANEWWFQGFVEDWQRRWIA